MTGKILLATLALSLSTIAIAEAAPACHPPSNFNNPSPPNPAPVEELLSHTEEVFVHQSLDVVSKAIAGLELEDQIYRGMALPRISGTYTLQSEAVGKETSPGLPHSRTLVCFSDGSTVLEQPLEVTRTASDFRYFYVVWNYTSDAFSAVDYAVADIRYIETPGKNTVVSWTYSFKPNTKKHPQYRGVEGEKKFRKDFLEGPFAELLRGSLAIWKVRAEAVSAP